MGIKASINRKKKMPSSLGARSVILDSTTQCADWSVKFDVKIDGVQLKNENTWSNVLGFQTDTRYGSTGYRQPQVFVRDEVVRGEIKDAVLGVRTSMGSYASWGSGYTFRRYKKRVAFN